jgi:hypothetical protein
VTFPSLQDTRGSSLHSENIRSRLTVNPVHRPVATWLPPQVRNHGSYLPVSTGANFLCIRGLALVCYQNGLRKTSRKVMLKSMCCRRQHTFPQSPMFIIPGDRATKLVRVISFSLPSPGSYQIRYETERSASSAEAD